MSCCCCKSGYDAWSPMDAYMKNQGVMRPDGIYLLSIDTGGAPYVSDIPPGPGNPNWAGPFTLENLNRKLNNEKANAQ